VSLNETLAGAVVMAPMTKGSNLPYRRLCIELGARVLMSEMVVARRLKQRRQSEFALIRRAPGEPCFGVQLAGNKPDEMAWAAALVESRGADFIDVNLGCPIDHFTRMGLGAALARQPGRVARIVAAMRAAVTVPVTVKIRLGWNKDSLNYLELAKAAVDAGAAAITVHGRTREARYRHPADWDRIAEIAAAVPIPVIGNGDVLFAHEAVDRIRDSGCIAVMAARGVLMTPWLFREMTGGYEDLSAGDRVALYRRYVTLALEHWGDDEHGRSRLRPFLRWHLGFWCRYAPRRADGSWPTMQQREGAWEPRSPLESWLARTDDVALEAITDQLLRNEELSEPPAATKTPDQSELVEAG
jgi:tRNA-dihydrouridine synthase 3